METDILYLSKVFKEEYECVHNCESHIFKCSFHIELQHIMDQIATVHEGEKPLNSLSCHTCQKDFTSKTSLRSRIIKFHEVRRNNDVKDLI